MVQVTASVALQRDFARLVIPGREDKGVERVVIEARDNRFTTFERDFRSPDQLLRDLLPSGSMGPILFRSNLGTFGEHLQLVTLVVRHGGMPFDNIVVYDDNSGSYREIDWDAGSMVLGDRLPLGTHETSW